jgi:hypothetical protein
MARIIEVVVSPTGDTTIQTRGYIGSECLQASEFLEQALGSITADHRTNEYYQTQQVQQQIQQ